MLYETSVSCQEEFDQRLPVDGYFKDDGLVFTYSFNPAQSATSGEKSTCFLTPIRQRNARAAEKKAALDEAGRLKSIEGHFKPSTYRPEPARDADKIAEVSLFPPAVRKMHPAMFRSPNRNDVLDFEIWTETGDHRKVLAAQCERGKWNRAVEQKLAVEAEKWRAAAATVTEADLDEARARLGAWLAKGDTQQKVQNRGKEVELMLLWRAWTIGTRRLGRDPKPGEFAKDVEAIKGGAEFVTTHKSTRVRLDKMKAFHADGGPWGSGTLTLLHEDGEVEVSPFETSSADVICVR
jgi:hypothetical protein